ncbi:MAG: conjugal transfer protein TraH [Candidatus Omnitrophica bacterium]|nr:conjugal transfer protein TraH [Candidatus Omnitrophota bacterium]
MKKTLLVLIFLFVCNYTSYADIFSKDDAAPYTIESALSEDKSGFYYRGGVDYNPLVAPEEPGVGYSIISGSKGCSGFDFASSFSSLFSQQVLEDYLKGISSEAMASAPMLLLEYVSPTLADIVKHFNTMTNMRLGLRYAQCEDIEKAAGEYIDKLRKTSESECVKEKVAQGLDIDSALKACKGGNDPFAYLKNAEGISLIQGGRIDVISDIFKKINIPQERKDFVKSVVGETAITSSQIENNKGQKSIYSVNEGLRTDAIAKLASLVDGYVTSKSISEEALKEISLPNNPIVEEQIKDIALMPRAKQYMAISKIASDIAYFKTIAKYRQAMDDLLEAMRAPGLADVQRGILERDYNALKEKLERFKEERQIYKNYNEAMAGILSEAEKEKLNIIMNDDGTDSYFSDSMEKQEKKEMYLPTSEEKGK